MQRKIKPTTCKIIFLKCRERSNPPTCKIIFLKCKEQSNPPTCEKKGIFLMDGEEEKGIGYTWHTCRTIETRTASCVNICSRNPSSQVCTISNQSGSTCKTKQSKDLGKKTLLKSKAVSQPMWRYHHLIQNWNSRTHSHDGPCLYSANITLFVIG